MEPTEAVLFRRIESEKPTLLLDEIDAVLGKDAKHTQGIRAVLNAGYRRGACVARCVGTDYVPVDYSVYCPKAFAGIGNPLPDTVRDRSIPILLQRRAHSDNKPERLRQATLQSEVEPIRGEIAAWADANKAEIAAMRPSFPDELSDRQQDAWEVLVAIADRADGVWPRLAREAAVALHEGATDLDVGVLLLAHLRELFTEARTEKLSTLAILSALVNRGDDSPWAQWWCDDVDHGRTKGPGSKLAGLLKPYGIESTKVRLQEKTAQGYHRASFEDAWSRYLPHEGQRSQSHPEGNGTTEQPCSEPVSGVARFDSEMASDLQCSVVPSFGEAEQVGMLSKPEIPVAEDDRDAEDAESQALWRLLDAFPGAEVIE